MKGLFLKDLYSMKWYMIIVVCLVVFMVIWDIVSFNTDYEEIVPLLYIIIMSMSVYMGLFGSVVPIGLVNSDMTEKWANYSMTMPVSRKQYISEKYLIGIISTAVFVVLIFPMQLMTFDLNINFAVTSIFLPFAACMIIQSVVCPFAVRFGQNISVFVLMVVMFVLGIVSAFLPDGLLEKMGMWQLEWYITMGIFTGAATIYILSWVLSVKIFERKPL